ncbi:MAG TPA: ABC transporter substrate-binding protein [Chloroflexia bacterium]|jgi:branched-chain amino acid transport system substrate-binding protein
MKGKQSGHVDAGGYNRREFIVNAGKAAGALLALPLLAKAQGVAAESQPAGKSSGPARSTERRTVGVLLPQSSAYPQLGANFLAGMNLYFTQSGRNNVKVVSAEIGTCCGQIKPQTRAMLGAQKLDLMVGLVNPSVAASISHLLEAAKMPFLATGLGENLARAAESNPYIFHHTLGMWESNYALGKWAATTLGRKAVMASSFYDSGYDTLHAFRMGFEAGGGQVLSIHVTHQPAADNGVAALVAGIKQSKPDVVFASYYGQSAVDLLNAYARAGLSRSVPLLGTAFLVDQAVVNSVGSAAAGVTTALPWAASLDTADNKAFVTAYKNKTGKSPDAFAALGFETAGLIASAIDRAAGGSLRDALAAASFAGPRGNVAMNAGTQSTTGTHYLQQAKHQGINVRTAVLAGLPAGFEQDGEVSALRNSVKTGWVSSYLCG